MKVIRTVCIDAVLLKDLEKINSSELINRLLLEHFNADKMQNSEKLKQEKANIEQILKENRKKLRILNKNLIKIKEKENTAISNALKSQNFTSNIETKIKILKYASLSKNKKIAQKAKKKLKQLEGGVNNNE